MAIHNGMNVLARRLRMFKRDSRCYWCGVVMALHAEGQPNHATIDHLYSKLHPLRPVYHKSGHDRGTVLHVLACGKCNHERGVADQEGRVFIPKLDSRREIATIASAAVGVSTVDEYRTKVKPKSEPKPKRPQRALTSETVRGFGWTDMNGDLRPCSWDEYCAHRPAFIGPAFDDSLEHSERPAIFRRETICTIGELLEHRSHRT